MNGRDARMNIRIEDIFEGRLVEEVLDLDEARIESFRPRLDQLPPVTVFVTEDGLVLADGFHRVAAAQREGRAIVDAIVRAGSASEAIEYASLVDEDEIGTPDRVLRAVP